MEKTERKKSRSRVPSGRDNTHLGSRTGTHSGATNRKNAVATRRTAPGALIANLDPDTARQAIILSEIIGKPVSKRRSHR